MGDSGREGHQFLKGSVFRSLLYIMSYIGSRFCSVPVLCMVFLLLATCSKMIHTATLLEVSSKRVELIITNSRGRKRDSYFSITIAWERKPYQWKPIKQLTTWSPSSSIGLDDKKKLLI